MTEYWMDQLGYLTERPAEAVQRPAIEWHELLGAKGLRTTTEQTIIRWDDDTERDICSRYSVLEPGERWNASFATHWAVLTEPADTRRSTQNEETK